MYRVNDRQARGQGQGFEGGAQTDEGADGDGGPVKGGVLAVQDDEVTLRWCPARRQRAPKTGARSNIEKDTGKMP